MNTTDRIEGMLYGLAVGDALGNTTEGQRPDQRHGRYGEIRDYLPNRFLAGQRGGTPTDDTQMAFWTLEHLLEHHELVPEVLAETFVSHRIFGIGSTVKDFCRAYRRDPAGDWRTWGRPSAGNGALMRISPVALVPWLGTEPAGEAAREPARQGDAAEVVVTDMAVRAGALTHNDPASIGSCVALARICWDLLNGHGRPADPMWWLERWIELSRPFEGDAVYEPRGGRLRGWKGPLWRFLDTHVREAFTAAVPTVEACNTWYSGAFLLETVPSVVYILMRHGADAEEAIVRAVNDTKDNDTIAAIVGTVMGAACGRSQLPARWISGLSGKVDGDDDGAVQQLVVRAVAASSQ